MTFFAAPALMLQNLDRQGSALVPPKKELEDMMVYTSGGKNRVELDQYDAFILVALGFKIAVTELCASEYGVAEYLQWGPVAHLLSHACFAAMLNASLEQSASMDLADKIRAVSDRPIVLCPRPFPSEIALNAPPLRDDPRFRDRAFLESVVTQARSAGATVSARHGAEVVWQDSSTVSIPGFTKAEFGVGAISLKTAKENDRREDGRHMNANYGLLMLTAVLRRLDDLSAGRILARR